MIATIFQTLMTKNFMNFIVKKFIFLQTSYFRLKKHKIIALRNSNFGLIKVIILSEKKKYDFPNFFFIYKNICFAHFLYKLCLPFFLLIITSKFSSINRSKAQFDKYMKKNPDKIRKIA